MLALVALAHAHVPHDKVVFTAAPADLAGPWCALLDPWAEDVLACTENRDEWTHLGADPLADSLVAGGVLDDGTIVLAAADRLWISADGAWEGRTLDFGVGVLAAEGDTLWLGGADGLYVGPPEGPFEASLPGVVTALNSSADGVAAVVDGEAWRYADGWVDLGAPAEDIGAITASPTGVYVGTASGAAWRGDAGGWAECGALPTPEGEGTWYPDVTRLALDGETLLVGTAWRAPFVSEDACTTWEDRHAPLDTDYDHDGHAESTDEAVTTLAGDDGTWLVSGWAGVAYSTDAGDTWESPLLLPPDFIRGLAASPAYADDSTVYIGGYAAGVERTFDGGVTLDAPSLGLGQPNVQSLEVAGTGDDQAVLTIDGHHAWWSRTKAEHWLLMGSPYENDARAWFVGSSNRWWVAGYEYDDRDGGISESTDRGATWTPLDGVLEAAGGMPDAVLSDGILCVVGAAVACSEDDGETWDTRYAPDAQIHAAVAVDARLVIAVGSRVEVSDDGGESWTVGLETGLDSVRFLSVNGERIWGATNTSRVLWSDDGGLSWEEAGVRVPGTVLALSAVPDGVLIGASDGTFRYADGELTRWASYQRVDDTHSEYVTCGKCTTETLESAALGTVTRVPEGANLTLQLRGTWIGVIGASEGKSEVELWVDGERAASFGDETDGIERVASVGGLADGWHEVRLVGVKGEGVTVDGFEAYGEAPPEEEGRKCGCGGAGGGAAVVLGALVRLRRRAGQSGR